MPDDEESGTVEYLKHRRKYMRSEITKINSKVQLEFDTLTLEEKDYIPELNE